MPCKTTFIRCLYVAGVVLTMYHPPSRWRWEKLFEKETLRGDDGH